MASCTSGRSLLHEGLPHPAASTLQHSVNPAARNRRLNTCAATTPTASTASIQPSQPPHSVLNSLHEAFMGQDNPGPPAQGDGGDEEKGAAPSVCFSGGQWITSTQGRPSLQLSGLQLQVPELGINIPVNPFLERGDNMAEFSPSLAGESGKLGSGSLDKDRNPSMWRMSGIAIGDLFQITTDPKVQKRVMQADRGNTGRISRQDILKVMQSEATAKKKLKWGLLIGGALLAFCLLMLAANAGLTYAVVAMSKETSVQTSGVMTNKDGSTVIGTAAAAETADLLYAYHTPAEQSAALLTLKSLLISSDNSTGNGTIAAYQVLSSHLVPGQRLEFVVVAPSFGGGAAGVGPVAEMIRIIVDSEGVHEVRGGPTNRAGIGGSRRLLATPPGVLAPNYMRGSITGQLTGMTAGCASGSATCSAAATAMSCPAVPTCGTNGKLYTSTCAAAKAGVAIRCTNCARGTPPTCPAAIASGTPAGMPGNLASDGHDYVRTTPSTPDTAAGAARPPIGGTTTSANKKPPPPPKANARRVRG